MMKKLMRYMVCCIENAVRMGQYWTVGDSELWTTDNVKIGDTWYSEIVREFPNKKVYRMDTSNAKMVRFLTKVYKDKAIDKMPSWMEEHRV